MTTTLDSTTLEAELDALPDLIDQAVTDGDEQVLAGLMARERILQRKIEHARREEARVAAEAARRELGPLSERLAEATAEEARIKLAAAVYARQAERAEARTAQLQNMHLRAHSRVRELDRASR